ncbi:acyltransferase [Myxococcota bacterium]|nr:acyltransferase [Myxococcota bacterium]
MSAVREAVKALLRGLARGAVLPEVAAYELAARVAERDVAFHHASQWLSLLPGYAGIYTRREFYRLTLAACSDDCQLSFGTVISHPGTRIGRRVYVGLHGNLGLCELGDDVLFGSDVHVLSGTRQHAFDDPDVPINQQGGHFEQVRIGANTWVGNGARVMADVGEGCVVGAGAVVTRAIPAWSVAVGHPARVVSQRR